MLGVISAASGKSASVSAASAPDCISPDPLLAAMTGSITTLRAPYSASFCAATRISSAEGIMPVFTASGGMSANTASSCCARNSGGTSRTAATPVVFCAVSAVMAVVAYTPFIAMVLRSA